MPRVAVIRSMVMNHMIHHRAQLGVYLRLNDIPVPANLRPVGRTKQGLSQTRACMAEAARMGFLCRTSSLDFSCKSIQQFRRPRGMTRMPSSSDSPIPRADAGRVKVIPG